MDEKVEGWSGKARDPSSLLDVWIAHGKPGKDYSRWVICKCCIKTDGI